MIRQSQESGANELYLWDWIPTGDFRLPSATIQTTFRTRLQLLQNWYRKIPSESDTGFLNPEKLESLSSFSLERLVPPIDWLEQAKSLDAVLMPWCESSGRNYIVILNVPHSGNAEMLKYWAEANSLLMISPPSPSDLLKYSDDSVDPWFEQFDKKASCWVLPELERCFLRHEAGLFRIRKFFELLAAGRLGVGIVGCSSWAWSYFRYAMGASAPYTMVGRPFDALKLESLLRIQSQAEKKSLLFRQSDNGRLILPSEMVTEDGPGKDKETDPYLRDLAAYSFGIAGVALAYWRSSLQAEPESLNLEESHEEKKAGQTTIWVKPWINVEKPSLTDKMHRSHAFILHNLLLHDSLDIDTLSKLLPESFSNFGQALYDLSDRSLIEDRQGYIQVSAKGYPAVRGYLKTEGFLTDDFT